MKSLLSIAFFALYFAPVLAQTNYYSESQYKGDTLFPFEIALLDMDSTQVSNSKELLAIPKIEKDKKPTVIAFWLTTCIPCHYELMAYTSHYAEWKNQANFNMYAISIDFPRNFRKISQIAREKKFPFPVLWDRDRLFRNVMPGNLNGLPQVFIFDKNGKLAYKHKGFQAGDEAELFAKILALQ